MKKKYSQPQATAIEFFSENDMAGATITVGSNQSDAITNEDSFLSNKKDTPIWGEEKKDMWDNMN